MFTVYEENAPDFNGCVYYAYQREICPTTGREHWQCYAVFPKDVRFTALQRRYPGSHIESKKGTPKQASEYCTKRETRKGGTDPVTFGEIPSTPHDKGGEATKRKYEKAFEAAKQSNFEEIPKELLIRHYNTFKQIADDNMPKPKILDYDVTPNLWYFGPTGTGKSKRARRDNPDAYIKSTTNEWWDKYKGEDVAIIEDFSPFEIRLSTNLKIWSDRYPFPANKKFGGATIRPKVVIVTSNYTIKEIFREETTWGPLERRFKQVEFVRVHLPVMIIQ